MSHGNGWKIEPLLRAGCGFSKFVRLADARFLFWVFPSSEQCRAGVLASSFSSQWRFSFQLSPDVCGQRLLPDSSTIQDKKLSARLRVRHHILLIAGGQAIARCDVTASAKDEAALPPKDSTHFRITLCLFLVCCLASLVIIQFEFHSKDPSYLPSHEPVK